MSGNVHEAISKHSKKQHEVVKTFINLEQMRELYIEEAVDLCQQTKPFTVDKINAVTRSINDLAKKGIVPTRKYVTEEMVKTYVGRK
ncbi:YpbS family protein [Cytobacillus sp. S13-E01]|uniref:YpbS family protein n=1 Tax=Cytobacillus sp. S13-E01 TaxID=3031326 RepID=UPI0023D80511|nr:YpbS family protein [Cytobacillus sp. S13-E01]MDF0727899.1 YpbS family protein [Cytobacillus sp. S13-E01]